MTTSLVRSRTLITQTLEDGSVEEIENGAVLQKDGIIEAVGQYDDLHRRYPDVSVIGTGNEIVLPGFVNAHHHVGLTPLQLGSPDMPLELWFITRMICRNVNLYLDTLYSAFEMIGSGITTVQHIHGWMPGELSQVQGYSEQVLKAYDDIGMRVSYCFALRDQNRLVYQADDEFVRTLPASLQDPMRRWFDRFRVGLDESMSLFHSLHESYGKAERSRIQLAPANLHWCSDEALTALSDTSSKFDVPMHMHLVETAYQKAYAKKRGGCTALEYLDRFDMLSPRLTLGHGVWLNESDIERMAETGVCLCHNCSSNFRLRSGVAPLNAFEKNGINTGIGLDEAGINDDRDMLQEMRMVLRAHRVPGMNDDVPTTSQVLRMATVGGARTTPYGESIGVLSPGKAADLSLHDWTAMAYPFLDENTSVLDATIQRAKQHGVRTVMCAGEVIYRDGEFTRVDKDNALKNLHDELQSALSDDEVERRRLSKALLPFVRNFYSDYLDPEQKNEPFYQPSARH
ncbi:MAG: amidohydrolase family protein [Granulosicoccus sp.]